MPAPASGEAAHTAERRPLRVGSRTSALARWQAERVLEGLEAAGVEAVFAGVRTRGDADQNPAALGRGDGVFVAALERALLRRDVDLAVHSLKDMPTVQPAALEVAAVLTRHDARECVVGAPLAALGRGARVGTSSPRRAAFLRALRPDLVVVPVRGNVPRRVSRVAAGEVDAVVLALAGLERLGMAAEVAEVLDLDLFPPAAGQGAIAVEVRSGEAPAALRALDDAAAHRATAAERALLRALGGSCDLPLGAYAEVLQDGALRLRARFVAPDGTLRGADVTARSDAAAVGQARTALGA